MDMLKPDVILGSILYAVIGVAVLWISFIVIDKLTPYKLWKRSSNTRTSRWRSWSGRCSSRSGRSWRRRFTGEPRAAASAWSDLQSLGYRGHPKESESCR